MTPFYHEHIPNTSGIYRITCIVTKKIYIGSAVNLRRRCQAHLGTLQRNEHRNPKVQAAFNKYGEQSFTFEVLELVLLPEMLTAREQYWFDKLKPFGRKGFNLAPIAGSTLNKAHSIETKAKISSAKRGKPSSNLGKKKTLEAIERHRRSLTGYKHSEETKRNMGIAHEGSKRSPETRERMRIAALGHAPTNARAFILTDPHGIEHEVYNLAAFCREHHLCKAPLGEVARGHRKQHKGWKARYAETDAG